MVKLSQEKDGLIVKVFDTGGGLLWECPAP